MQAEMQLPLPVQQYLDDSSLVRRWMVALKTLILICVGGLICTKWTKLHSYIGHEQIMNYILYYSSNATTFLQLSVHVQL